MMPVSLLIRNHNIPGVDAVYGSLWTGRADLRGDYRLEWSSKLGWGHLETPITLSGADTRVTGAASFGVTGVALKQVTGRAGPGLAQLIPGAWQCDMTARVSDVAGSWGWFSVGAAGQVSTPEGSCEKGNRSIDIPPLSLDLTSEGPDAVATLREPDAPPMAVARIRRDRVVDIRIEPTAADVFPALPRSGPITLQVPF